MTISKENLYRILIARNDQPLVNIVYAEIESEVCGAFSGDGGGGVFYFNEDNEAQVSDDFAEFEPTSLGSFEEVEKIYSELERLRSEFEEYDEDGNLIGISEEGIGFLGRSEPDEDGYIECYSEDASEDYIYDLQDEWNLNFYKF